MVMDRQGRICLGKQLCEEMEFTAGKSLRLVYEGAKKYRLILSSEVKSSDKVVGSDMKMDEKNRIYIPMEVRELYNNHVLVYGTRETLFIEFQATKLEEQFVSALKILAERIEKLV